jgi:hypothetical protein
MISGVGAGVGSGAGVTPGAAGVGRGVGAGVEFAGGVCSVGVGLAAVAAGVAEGRTPGFELGVARGVPLGAGGCAVGFGFGDLATATARAVARGKRLRAAAPCGVTLLPNPGPDGCVVAAATTETSSTAPMTTIDPLASQWWSLLGAPGSVSGWIRSFGSAIRMFRTLVLLRQRAAGRRAKPGRDEPRPLDIGNPATCTPQVRGFAAPPHGGCAPSVGWVSQSLAPAYQRCH